MAPKTDTTLKKRRHSPYARPTIAGRAKGSPDSSSRGITPDASAAAWSPQATAATSTKETLRDCFLELCRKKYPNIEPRDDHEIQMLSAGIFKGDDRDFYKFADDKMDKAVYTVYRRPFTAEEKVKGMAILSEQVKKLLDGPGNMTGRKPSPGEEDVHIRPIPDSEFSLRVWGKGLAESHEYCLDFVRTSTGEPVNSPFKFELWAVPDTATPWLPRGTARLASLESAFGIKQKDILPGEEKFVVLEGTPCRLTRPGKTDVYFTIPIRPRPSAIPDYMRNAHVIKF